jgi:hypothetical protein
MDAVEEESDCTGIVASTGLAAITTLTQWRTRARHFRVGQAGLKQLKIMQQFGQRCMLYNMGYERTNIYLSKPQKAALEKMAKQKGISVAELVRRIIDQDLDCEQKQKG